MWPVVTPESKRAVIPNAFGSINGQASARRVFLFLHPNSMVMIVVMIVVVVMIVAMVMVMVMIVVVVVVMIVVMVVIVIVIVVMVMIMIMVVVVVVIVIVVAIAIIIIIVVVIFFRVKCELSRQKHLTQGDLVRFCNLDTVFVFRRENRRFFFSPSDFSLDRAEVCFDGVGHPFSD